MTTSYDGRELEQEYMLCVHYETGYIFQIICISGYYAGNLAGYIKDENIEGHNAVSEAHLIKELKRNISFKEDSLQIIE